MKPLSSFRGVKRIVICSKNHALYGQTGRVWRMRLCDDSAWVTMDNDLPEKYRAFPVFDIRKNNILLHPRLCSIIINGGKAMPSKFDSLDDLLKTIRYGRDMLAKVEISTENECPFKSASAAFFNAENLVLKIIDRKKCGKAAALAKRQTSFA